ncbi:hypothetical protein MG296_10800 [Flavobacteriaceae bacterium TK19130]|nr:hypothetical protein [Thermobacterium salinum]
MKNIVACIVFALTINLAWSQKGLSTEVTFAPLPQQTYTLPNQGNVAFDFTKLKPNQKVRFIGGPKEDWIDIRKTANGIEFSANGAYFQHDNSLKLYNSKNVLTHTIDAGYLKNNSNQRFGLLQVFVAVCCIEIEYESNGAWHIKYDCDCLSIELSN